MIAGWLAVSAEADPDGSRRDASIIDALSAYAKGGSSAKKLGAGRLASASVSNLHPPTESFWRGNSALELAFDGWLDNGPAIADQLRVPFQSDAQIFALATERWGVGAQRQLIGSYSAIILHPGGKVSLLRSPWTAPPLYYAQTPDGPVMSTLVRAIFAAGHPKRINYEFLAQTLAFNFETETPNGWYEGVHLVPQGSIVDILPDQSVRINRWYDPNDIALEHFSDPAEYLARAEELITEATRAALVKPKKPAIALSGGLDSPIIAAEIMRQVSTDKRLTAVTFRPDKEWDGIVPDVSMGDEAALVRKYQEMHPRLDVHFTREGGFDNKLREVFRASGITTINVSNIGMFHGVWDKARELGCDWLLDAESANDNFSAAGSWSYQEDFLRGHWRELYLTLKNRGGDARPLWRKFAALSILPLMPATVQSTVRNWAHPQSRSLKKHGSLLKADRLAQLNMNNADQQYSDEAYPGRKGWLADCYTEGDGGAADIHLAFEQIYGLRRRDVAAYRPLFEFTASLPTRAFVSGGEDRWLARQLAKGRMPEAQRTNQRYGAHNADWHIRISRRREELSEYAENMRAHPWLNDMIDIDRLQALLDDWPEQTPLEPHEAFPRHFGITRAIAAAQFIGHVEGRNDL